MTSYADHMTIAQIIHDFATTRGDLTDPRAREDLAAILEQRMVAERDEVHEKGYWVGYREGKDEAETRDLDFDAAKDDADKCREVAATLTIALATAKADAWDEGHRTYRKLGSDECECGAWHDAECGCGLYGTNVITPNPYRATETEGTR